MYLNIYKVNHFVHIVRYLITKGNNVYKMYHGITVGNYNYYTNKMLWYYTILLLIICFQENMLISIPLIKLSNTEYDKNI